MIKYEFNRTDGIKSSLAIYALDKHLIEVIFSDIIHIVFFHLFAIINKIVIVLCFSPEPQIQPTLQDRETSKRRLLE